ncbi:response regulator transcription factor [bacterium]|nr:response regulator transcription factor [bacterium]MBU1883158.1 response regulator transcription factor [bacterium]
MTKNLLLLKDKSVLLAEDDTITRTEMAGILEMLFKSVYSAHDGEKAYQLYEDKAPDIILTDIKMPKMDGLNLIRKIRQNNYDIPIILLTSFADKEFLLDASNLSIDGYLVKPIELEKLTYTLCKALQRIHNDVEIVPLGKQLFYNSATKELYLDGSIVVLGAKEHQLLLLLIENRHRTVTKEEIEKELWPFDAVSNSAIKKLILRIRQKIKLDIIVSVRGIGYRLDTRKTPR